MKCPNCQQWTCPTPVSCLRVQLAAANERAGLAEIDARQERELREACEKALAEANECADREAEARDEDMRAAHGRFEALSAALATERAARERAEQAQASLAEKLDRVNEALASALPEGVAVESVADGVWALKAREGKAIRERDEAVKRADAMAGALRRVDQVLDFDNEESYVCDDREGAVWTAHGILKGARETFAALDAARGR